MQQKLKLYEPENNPTLDTKISYKLLIKIAKFVVWYKLWCLRAIRQMAGHIGGPAQQGQGWHLVQSGVTPATPAAGAAGFGDGHRYKYII